MNSLPETQPLPSDLSDRSVTFSFLLHDQDVVSLRSCDVVGRGFRNRISFHDNNPMEDVLVERLSSAIRVSLRNLPDGAHVLSLPDFLVELPGLILAGARVMVSDIKDGSRSAIVRFKEFVGAVTPAFKSDVGLQEYHASYSEKLAMSVLEEICLPILNICRTLDVPQLMQERRVSADLKDRAREFEFQTELLKRFVFNSGLSKKNQCVGHYIESGP
ncbi:MAG: hypothetical protein AAF665_19500, partial [Pseudomonadota bacterium]